MNLSKSLEGLFTRLMGHERIHVLEVTELAEALNRRDKVLLGLFSDPAIHSENLDLAVILPELLRVFPTLSAIVPRASISLDQARRFGVSVFPALALIQNGQAVQALDRIRPWPEYAATIQDFLSRTD